jgi:putative hydrolase of the HAD superfamily
VSGSLEAVVFDYGDTLIRYRYDEATHVRSLATLLDHLGATGVDGRRLFGEVDRRLGPALEARGDGGEIDYEGLVREALATLDVDVDDGRLTEAMRAGHREWDANVAVHPDALELLHGVRERGLKVGLVSNAIDPGVLLREDLALNGIAEMVDEAVFSSELGIRKPHPGIYRHVLDALGVEPPRALFVGDRVLEDVVGPSNVGMHTCLAVYLRRDAGDHSLADHVAQRPLDVLGILDCGGQGQG